MSEQIKKLTQVIRDNADIDYGTLRTLKMIDDEADKFSRRPPLPDDIQRYVNECKNLSSFSINRYERLIEYITTGGCGGDNNFD